MSDLAVIIPTRGRPENIRKVIDAWTFTGAWADAHMVLAVDADDPEISGYREILDLPSQTNVKPFSLAVMDEWMPMVHKLNRVAVNLAEQFTYRALAFAGDDHLPQTIGWAKRYLTVLRELGTGMVYGDDGYQGAKLSTEWAVTADVVRALGRMVPAPVEHLYCDNAIMEMFGAAGALRHLPEVRIEHMHPIAGKAAEDAQYKRVNSTAQYHRDRLAYQRWTTAEKAAQVGTVRRLRAGRPEVPAPYVKTARKVSRVTRLPFPRHFKRVIGATPPEIELTLADLAAQVPEDQEIVELGVFQGRTALIMAWGARQGHGAHVTGIDLWDDPRNTYDAPFTDPGSERWARHHVQSLGYSGQIRLIKGHSAEIADTWIGDPEKPVGLLFVDGDHSAEGARQDIEAWAPHLADGARIAVDDYGHPDWPGVKEAVDALVDEGFLEPVEVFHDRLAVTRLAVRPDWENGDNDPADGPTSHGVEPGTDRVTAITGEGVATSPDPEPEDEAEELFRQLTKPDNFGTVVDVSSNGVLWDNADEAEFGRPGTPIENLTIPQLKALAKVRGIVLGARKDKRDLIIEAIKAGQ